LRELHHRDGGHLPVAQLSAPAVLRPATPRDTPFLDELDAEARGGELAAAGLPPGLLAQLVAGQVSAARADRAARFPGAERYIAVFEGDPAGAVLLDARAAEVVVVDLAVLQRLRRRGVGAAILHAVCDRAGGRDVVLSVARDNAPALSLYARAGFAADGGTELDLRLRRAAGGRATR
jgi:GNAT superfamily N-acetyltransferase